MSEESRRLCSWKSRLSLERLLPAVYSRSNKPIKTDWLLAGGEFETDGDVLPAVSKDREEEPERWQLAEIATNLCTVTHVQLDSWGAKN